MKFPLDLQSTLIFREIRIIRKKMNFYCSMKTQDKILLFTHTTGAFLISSDQLYCPYR